MVVLPYDMALPLIEEFKQGTPSRRTSLPPSIKRKLERSRQNIELNKKFTRPQQHMSENDKEKTDDTFFTPMHSPSQLEASPSQRFDEDVSPKPSELLLSSELGNKTPNTRVSGTSHSPDKAKAISALRAKLLSINAISPGGHLHRFKRKDTIKKADINCLLNYAFDEEAIRPLGSAAFIDWVRATGFISTQFSEKFKKQLQTVPSTPKSTRSQIGRGWICL